MVFCVFLAPLGARAQLFVGPALGGRIAWTTLGGKEYRADYGARPVGGFDAGGTVAFRVKDQFYLYSSVLYSLKGTVIKGKDDPMLRHHARYQFVNIPLTYTMEFKQRMGRGKTYWWFAGAGPTINYWLSGRGRFFNADLHEIGKPPMNYRILFNGDPGEVADGRMTIEYPNRFQLGLNFTGGIVLQPLGYDRFIFMLRYEVGHTYLSGKSDGLLPNTVSYTQNLKTRVMGVSLSVAYLKDLKPAERKKGGSTLKHRGYKRK